MHIYHVKMQRIVTEQLYSHIEIKKSSFCKYNSNYNDQIYYYNGLILATSVYVPKLLFIMLQSRLASFYL